MKTQLLLAAVAITLAACGTPKATTDPVRPVVAQRVTPGAAASRDVYSGELRARYETDLGFRIPGKIVARLVDAGARVTKGQVLARLDPEDAKLAAQGASAQLASAEADFTLAKSELARYQDLLAKKFISQSAFDAKQNAFAAAQAKVEQVRTQAAITSNQANYTNLAADADGVIVSVTGEPGQVVAAGQPVLKLAHAGEKEVVVNAPEGQLARFKTGQDVAIQLWADPAKPFHGRIREIAGGADPVTRTYAVRVSAIDPPSQAQLGMTANVVFNPSADSGIVLLPLSALAGNDQKPAVWVIDPATSRVKLRAVNVGQYREDGVTIISGLNAGDVVVTAGVHKLRDGEPVRFAESGDSTQASN
ncbi:MAG: efflux RND transporter periplasmic adaptor subunit [Usitatibacter sp.]